MPDESTPGGTPGTPDPGKGGTPGGDLEQGGDRGRDGRDDAGDGQRRRDARAGTDTGEELRRALDAERQAHKETERELRSMRQAEQERVDAGKTELQKQTDRAEAAERRVKAMERETMARQVAAEAGIASMWDRLRGEDQRALRADATKLRQELGLGEGGMDGGVRGGVGVRREFSMDDAIRRSAGR